MFKERQKNQIDFQTTIISRDKTHNENEKYVVPNVVIVFKNQEREIQLFPDSVIKS